MRGLVWRVMFGVILFSSLPSCARLRPTVTREETAPAAFVKRIDSEQEPRIAYQADTDARGGTAVVRTAYEPPQESTDELTAAEFDRTLPPAPSGSYTLADLEQIAMENNPTLAQSQAKVSAAHGRHCQAGLYPNTIVGYMGSEIGGGGTAGQQGAFIEQEFVCGDKLGLSQDVVSQEINRLAWENETQRYRVLTSVRKGFYEVLTAQRQLELAQRLLETNEKGAEAAESLYKAKQGNKVDFLQARVEANNARITLQTSRNRLQAAWKRLATNLGVPDMVQTTLSGDVEGDSRVLDAEQSLQQILDTSPELSAAQAKVARAQAALERACAEPIPNMTAQIAAMYDYSEELAMAQVQIGFPLPIHNRNQGNIQASESEIVAAHREVERVRLELENRFASVLERYQNAQTQIERFRENILTDATESLELVTQGYRAGELDYLRYLTAQRTYFQTNVDYLAALREWWSARLELEGALLTDGLRAPAQD